MDMRDVLLKHAGRIRSKLDQGHHIMIYPQFVLIRQKFQHNPPVDIRASVKTELGRSGMMDKILPGQRVLITAGSRGIDSMKDTLAAVVAEVKAARGIPLILPAMGSHGGGTAAGQVEILENLGITEQSVGAPIHGRMEFVTIGELEQGCPVIVDRIATEVDHIILVNRVKEHTDYIGPTESGLLKMSVIGLGRRRGAEVMHRLAVNISYYRSIQAMAKVIIGKLNILGGVAILEDKLNHLRRLEAVPGDKLFEREPELLLESKAHKANLPVDALDLLIIDTVGKEVSGTGADTKVIGRIMNSREDECDTPKIMRILSRDLSEISHGNAVGIGLSDYITKRLFDKIDFETMTINTLTSSIPERGRIPNILATDRAAVEAALNNIGLWEPSTVRAAWITSTKYVERLAVTPAVALELKHRSDVEIFSDPFDLPFDENGELPFLKDLAADRRKK